MRTLYVSTLALLLATLSTLAISGCTRSTSDQASITDRPIILVLLKDYNNEFFRKIDEGLRSGLTKDLTNNYQLDVRYSSSWSDVSYEKRQLDQYFADYVVGQKEPKLKAVIIATGSCKDELTPEIKELRDNHVPVMLLDQRINPEALKRADTDYDAFIGSRNVEGGGLAADELVRHLPNGGTVLMLNGKAGVQAGIDRRLGFLNRLAELSKENDVHYKVIERSGNFTRSDSQSTLASLLSTGQQPDGIFAASDEMALGALEALRQKKSEHKTVVVGFDAIGEAVSAVKDGRLAATIAQDPVGIGQKAAATVDKLLRHMPIEKDQLLMPTVLNGG